MAARGVGRERRINESGIQQTVVAFDVTLKMPTSQQGTAAFCPPSRLALPLGSQGVRRDPAGEWPRCGGFLLAGPGQAQFSAFISHFPSAQLSLERDGRARVLLPTPARKYLHPRECFEKRGVSRTPLPRSLSAAGFVSHSRRQLLANAAIASRRWRNKFSLRPTPESQTPGASPWLRSC